MLDRVFQNSTLLLCRLHVCVKKRGAFKPSDEIKVVCDHSVIEISTSNYTYPTVVESTLLLLVLSHVRVMPKNTKKKVFFDIKQT